MKASFEKPGISPCNLTCWNILNQILLRGIWTKHHLLTSHEIHPSKAWFKGSCLISRKITGAAAVGHWEKPACFSSTLDIPPSGFTCFTWTCPNIAWHVMPRKFGKPCHESNWVKHQLRKLKKLLKIVTIGSFRNYTLKSKVIYLFCFKYFAFQILYDIWPLWQTKVLVRWMPVGRGTPHPSCCWLPAAPIRPAISDWQIFNGSFFVFFLFRP